MATIISTIESNLQHNQNNNNNHNNNNSSNTLEVEKQTDESVDNKQQVINKQNQTAELSNHLSSTIAETSEQINPKDLNINIVSNNFKRTLVLADSGSKLSPNHNSNNILNVENTNENSQKPIHEEGLLVKPSVIKANGLKNRKIQRPPPLVLDEVSNFYDDNVLANNHYRSLLNKSNAQHNEATSSNNTTSNSIINNNSGITLEEVVLDLGSSSFPSDDRINSSQASNQKFWASLSQDAQRRNSQTSLSKLGKKSNLGPDLIISHCRSGSNTSNTDRNSKTSPSHQKQGSSNSLDHSQVFRNHEIYQAFGNMSLKSYDAIDLNSDEQSINKKYANDGGNLIGVECNSSPIRPSMIIDHSKSNGNNPFESNLEVIDQSTNNFKTRPASFIAATEKKYVFKPAEDHDVREINYSHDNLNHDIVSDPANRENYVILLRDPQDHVDAKRNPIKQNNFGNQNHSKPTISIDSVNTVNELPPSATLQQPHWTEAIYELKNAIIEKNSVSGGSENGQLIYIAQGGDIILELDAIKVSGYTMQDFLKILDSQPVHLLKAVQTKNCHGISLDIKDFLNCSFPKQSSDKDLQETIRENIYRSTISCTTRPKRPHEVDGLDYIFINRDEFDRLNERGLLIECGSYKGHLYGTLLPMCDRDSVLGTRTTTGQIKDQVNKAPQEDLYQAMKPAVSENQVYTSNQIMSTQIPFTSNPNQSQIDVQRLQQVIPPTSTNHYSFIEPPNNSLNSIHVDWMGTNQHDAIFQQTEILPFGWERVIDHRYGCYYIDHNTQRTQYEKPFEVELIKNERGLGFTLLETDCGYLIVRSILIDGPAFLDGTIRPGDILISAMGLSLIGLQDTEVARFFSTFVQGARIRLVFARGSFVLDQTLEPDEYVFSNGTNGNPSYAINPNSNSTQMLQYQTIDQSFINQGTNNYAYDNRAMMINNDEESTDINGYEYYEFVVERGEDGFGINIIGGAEADRPITIGSIVLSGAASRKGELKSGDEILSINGVNVTGATHEYVVSLISSCLTKASMLIRRKKFADSCEIILNRNDDEGFGFVIISKQNCALIGRITEGSPAHRCQQLHVRDRIISVNGRQITPDMQHPEIVNMIKSCGNSLRLRIIPVDCYSVELIRNEKGFGFTIRGGAENNMPLYVLRFAVDGRARGLLNIGDEIIEINGVSTTGMTHEQAVNMIQCSDPIVKLKLRRNHVTPQNLLSDSPKSLQKTEVTAEITTLNRTPVNAC